MSRKIIIPVLTAFFGLLVGGATVDYIHRHNDQRMKQAFAQKERCRSLADRYIRENSKDETNLLLKEVDFSQASNSCIAAIDRFENYPAGIDENWEMVDLLSGKVTLIGWCSERSNCGNGRNIHFEQRLDVEFKSAIDGTEPPPDSPNK
jgi:hypothetical protein